MIQRPVFALSVAIVLMAACTSGFTIVDVSTYSLESPASGYVRTLDAYDYDVLSPTLLIDDKLVIAIGSRNEVDYGYQSESYRRQHYRLEIVASSMGTPLQIDSESFHLQII